LFVFSLPLARELFYLTYYCVPKKVFPEESRERARSWHEYSDDECKQDEIKKQFLKYTIFKKDTPFVVSDVIIFKQNGKLFSKAFGRIEKVNTLDKGWSYEVLTVSGDQIFTEKVMHDWIFARD